MANFSRVLERIVSPSPSLLPALGQLNRQINLRLADASGDGEFSAATFGTLTGSKRPVKPFIIGFIPPDNEVNFVPVQRSDAVLADVSSGGGGGVAKTDPGNIKAANYLPNPPRGKEKEQIQRVSPADLRQALIDAYVKITGQLPTQEQLTLQFAQVALENGYVPSNGVFYTKNYNMSSIHAGRNSGSYFVGTDHDAKGRPYQTAFVSYGSLDEASVHHMALLAERWPNTLGSQSSNDYNNALLPSRGIGQKKRFGKDFHEGGDKYKRRLDIQSNFYRQSFGDQPISSSSATPAGSVASGPSGRSIMKAGAANADDPLSNELGRNIQLADARRQESASRQTTALREQVTALQNTPPLVLLVNPKTFNRNYEVSSDSSVKGRYGNIVHNWLERPFTIETNGVTAGQYAVDAEGAGGLTNVNRVHSLSYANLLSLLLIYKNNGRIFAGSESDPGIPILAFTVFIYYDEHIYLGSFDSFNIEDGADKPYNMSYSFKFTVRYDRDVTLPMTDYLVSATLPF